MRFCRKVNDHIELFFSKQLINEFPIPDITFHKFEIRLIHNRFECFQISGISQKIQDDNLIFWVSINHVMSEITADESGAACN